MPNIFDMRHPARGVPLFFERQNRQQQIDVAAHAIRAIRTPRPQLRTNIINYGDAATMEPTSQTQIEVRPIDQDGCVRFSFAGRTFEFIESAPPYPKRYRYSP